MITPLAPAKPFSGTLTITLNDVNANQDVCEEILDVQLHRIGLVQLAETQVGRPGCGAIASQSGHRHFLTRLS